MYHDYRKHLPQNTGGVWPCRIMISGNPHLPKKHPDGVRYRVVYPDGSWSLPFHRYYTCIRLAEDFNKESTSCQ